MLRNWPVRFGKRRLETCRKVTRWPPTSFTRGRVAVINGNKAAKIIIVVFTSLLLDRKPLHCLIVGRLVICQRKLRHGSKPCDTFEQSGSKCRIAQSGVPTFLPPKIPSKEAAVQGEGDRNEFQEMYWLSNQRDMGPSSICSVENSCSSSLKSQRYLMNASFSSKYVSITLILLLLRGDFGR